MTIRLKSIAVAVASLASLIALPIQAAQSVAPPLQSEVLYVAPSQAVSMPINYSASAPEGNKEVGLGLRVHFDSSKLSFTSLSQSLQSGIQPTGDVQDDTNNADNDASTDKFFVLAWVDIAGNWPDDSSAFPLELFTGDFTANNAFTGSTKIAFTASSTSGGAAFNATSQTICRKPEVSLSTDITSVVEGGSLGFNVILDQALSSECGSFSVTLNTAGTATVGVDYQAVNTEVIFLPNESSVPVTITTLDDSLVEENETLVINLVGADNYSLSATQPTQTSFIITSNDTVAAMCIDIDGNGNADALTDGVTLARYLLGYRNNALIDNSLSADATRTTAAVVQSHIETYLQTGCFDIDGNSNLDALSDGILLIRYLSDYQGENLIAGAIGENATRTTASSVSAYIATLIAP